MKCSLLSCVFSCPFACKWVLGCKTQQDPAGLARACASAKCWQMQNIFDIIPIKLADVGFGRSIVLDLTQKQNLEDVIKVIFCSYIVFYYPSVSATPRADFLTWQDPDFCPVQSWAQLPSDRAEQSIPFLRTHSQCPPTNLPMDINCGIAVFMGADWVGCLWVQQSFQICS